MIDRRWWLIIVPGGLFLGVLVAAVMALPTVPRTSSLPRPVITPVTSTNAPGYTARTPVYPGAPPASPAPRVVRRTVTVTPRTPPPAVIVLPAPASPAPSSTPASSAPSTTTAPPTSTTSAPPSSEPPDTTSDALGAP